MPIADLQIQERDRVIVSATFGRGIWAMDAAAIKYKPSGGSTRLRFLPTARPWRFEIPRSTSPGVWNHEIMVMPLAGGAPHSVFGGPDVGALAWSADGRFLISADQGRDKKQYDVWRVPVSGGKPERLGLTLDRAV